MSVVDSAYEYYLISDFQEYEGEWIAVCGDIVIAHGKDVRQVAEKAKKVCGSKKFLLSRIPSEETMIF